MQTRHAATVTTLVTLCALAHDARAQSLFHTGSQAPGAPRPSAIVAGQPLPPNPVADLDGVSLYAIQPLPPRQIQVNDLVTIIVNQSSRIDRQQSLDTEKESKNRFAVNEFIDLGELLNARLRVNTNPNLPRMDVNSKREFDGEGSQARRDAITARITAKVLDVKPNGQVVLEARASIISDDEEQVMLISGVSAPRTSRSRTRSSRPSWRTFVWRSTTPASCVRPRRRACSRSCSTRFSTSESGVVFRGLAPRLRMSGMTHGGSVMRPDRSSFLRVAFVLLCALLAGPAHGASVKEIARLEGQGKSVLRGFGLVIGLPGTGDKADQLVVARPLAKLLENEGNPIGSFNELANARSVALVMVTCEIPATGARVDDELDVFVSSINNAPSLAGGRLFLAPLRGPLPGQGVFAFAEGPVIIEGANNATGRVRGGAKVVQNVNMQTVSPDGTITLVIHPAFAGWSTSQLLASIVNQHRLGLEETGEELARAMSERVVRIRIPEVERPDPANFIADIMGIRFDSSLLDLPARIIVNERGAIVATGNVEIGPTLITYRTWSSHRAARAGSRPSRSWAQAAGRRCRPPGDRPRPRPAGPARRVPADRPSVDDQIAILNMLRRSGNLHAEIITD